MLTKEISVSPLWWCRKLPLVAEEYSVAAPRGPTLGLLGAAPLPLAVSACVGRLCPIDVSVAHCCGLN